MLDTLGAALAHLEACRFVPAEAAARACVARSPEDLDAALVHGMALGALEAPEEAAAVLDRVARARAGQPHPVHALRGLLGRIDRAGIVVAQYRACLDRAPDDRALRLALVLLLVEEHQPDEAMALLAPLLPQPDLEVCIAAGLAEAERAEFHAAADHFRAALAIDPDCAAAWANLGLVLKVEGAFDASVQAADRAVALRPDFMQFRVNRAIALLRAGRLEAAWDDYDARLSLPGRADLPPETALNDPAQLDSLRGCTVLVYHEEGFGDTLQFIRYASLLEARGIRVVAWMPLALAALVARVPGIAAVAPLDRPVAHDAHCAVCDLPRVFRTGMSTIPAPIPYLRPSPGAVAAWAACLPSRAGGRRVGLVWAGQARPWMVGFGTLDGRRSIRLAEFAPLAAVPGLQFVSLQKGPAASQAASPPPGLALFDPTEALDTFDDTAALVANLDAVVAVDTAVAHVAGGMGVPVLLLDRYDSCWRWFAEREDSPWYPSLRIVRQQRPGDWQDVMQRAASLLAQPFTAPAVMEPASQR